jgi:FBD
MLTKSVNKFQLDWVIKQDTNLLNEFVEKQDGFRCLNQTLRRVKLRLYTVDIVVDMKPIKFFLLNANVLKLMFIEYWSDSVVDPSIVDELQKAKVTSSDAKVVIFCLKDKVTINVR